MSTKSGKQEYVFEVDLPWHSGWQGEISFEKRYSTTTTAKRALRNVFQDICKENNINPGIKEFIYKDYKSRIGEIVKNIGPVETPKKERKREIRQIKSHQYELFNNFVY